jgi:hypothetical protein
MIMTKGTFVCDTFCRTSGNSFSGLFTTFIGTFGSTFVENEGVQQPISHSRDKQTLPISGSQMNQIGRVKKNPRFYLRHFK